MFWGHEAQGGSTQALEAVGSAQSLMLFLPLKLLDSILVHRSHAPLPDQSLHRLAATLLPASIHGTHADSEKPAQMGEPRPLSALALEGDSATPLSGARCVRGG